MTIDLKLLDEILQDALSEHGFVINNNKKDNNKDNILKNRERDVKNMEYSIIRFVTGSKDHIFKINNNQKNISYSNNENHSYYYNTNTYSTTIKSPSHSPLLHKKKTIETSSYDSDSGNDSDASESYDEPSWNCPPISKEDWWSFCEKYFQKKF